MGNSILKGQLGKASAPPLLDETQIFTLWSISDVRELWKRFQNQIYGFALVEAQFESIISVNDNVAKHIKLEDLFDVLDNDHDGRIDGLELLGGLTLCCHATFEEKARFIFELFDFNLNANMSKKELIIMMMSSICGLNVLTGGGEELEPDIEVFEALAEDAIKRADLNSDGQISFEEFLYWARTNRELMAGLELLNKISADAKEDVDTDDSAPETDDDLSETDEPTGHKSALSGNDSKPHKAPGHVAPGPGDEATSTVQWLGQVYEPTNFRDKKRCHDGPDTNLELAWAFGYRAQGCRSNLRYVGPAAQTDPRFVVYYTAALGVVFDLVSRTQRFYMGHSDAVTSIAMHPSQTIVATADVKSNIHIWNAADCGSPSAASFPALSVIKGMGRHGIQHLAFSPLGDRVVSVGLDPDHTVSVYDIGTGAVVASAKGIASPSDVHDLAFSASGAEVAVVGKNQVKFFRGVSGNKRALDSHIGKIGSGGKRQTFYSVAYVKEDAVVGCASGELYRFRDGQLVQAVQAHGPKEAVLSLHFYKPDGTLLSGGKDGLVKFWDSTLQEVGSPLDLAEDLDGDGKADNGSMDCAVVSVQQAGGRVLIGTRGSDLFEARLPPNPSEHHQLTRIGWGHSRGELWGLAMHPLRGEFATCGGDRTLRIWSIRSREQINVRQMPEDARTLAYSPCGEVLCIGMVDGSAALIDTTTAALRVYSTFKHCSRAVNDVKFSPDGRLLALGGADSNIYLYRSADRKAFVRHAVCRGHSGSITHLDFSANSQYLQSNGAEHALLHWETEGGNQVKAASELRDESWATFTCTLGWPVQGIWPSAGCDYSDINACAALADIGDIVTGDDSHRVNLFRYPALKPGGLHQSYIGHASHVTNVAFSANRRFVATTGGLDRTVLLWRHDLEAADSEADAADGDSSASSSAASSAEGGVPGAGAAAAPSEAGWSAQELKAFVAEHKSNVASAVASRRTSASRTVAKSASAAGSSALSAGPGRGDESRAVQPWRSAIAEPSLWTPSQGCTDVDLTLEWVHGFRSYDCRNNVLYSAAGHVVYNAAALAVVFNKGAGKQQFLQGAHADEVVGIAAHPAGQVFATGEAGRKPSIVVWNSKDMEVLGRIEGAHEFGVPLLAFNSKGNILASVGLDSDSSLCIHDWSKGVRILRTATDRGKVLCLCFLANDGAAPADGVSAAASSDIVVTGGEKHLKFWWTQGQNVQSQRALWGEERRHTVMSVASTNKGICVTGSSSGALLIWKDFRAVMNVQNAARRDLASTDVAAAAASSCVRSLYPHASAIQTIWPIRGTVDPVHDLRDCVEGYRQSSRYLTGDKEGVVCVWRLVEASSGGLSLVLMKTFSVAQLRPKSTGPGVRSLCERDGIILVGSAGSEIYEVSEASLPFVGADNSPAATSDASSSLGTASPAAIAAQRLSAGHSVGEVWGLATHPYLPVALTTGDDSTIKCWHLASSRLLSFAILPDKSRAVDIRPGDDVDLAVVLNSGAVCVAKMEGLLNPHGRPSFKGTVDPQLDGAEIPLVHADSSTSAIDSLRALSDKSPGQLTLRELPQGPTQWCQVLRYSFDGSLLAAGSHDCNIYLYDARRDYALLHTLAGHPSFVTHLDFGLLLAAPAIESSQQTEEVEAIGGRKLAVFTDTVVSESFDSEMRDIVVTTKVVVLRVDPAADTVVSRAERVEREVRRAVSLRDICLQSNSGDHDLLFWRGDGTRVSSSASMKDAQWASLTCPLGWSVQGIWGADSDDATAVTAVARSHTWDKVPVLACVDAAGRLRLYNYPCVVPGASDKCYRVHGRNVTNIAFSFDDAYCVTTGGGDRGVIVWATDIQDEIRERAAFAAVSGGTLSDSITLDGEGDRDEEESFSVSKLVPTGGDEGGAVKPWKGAIREPSDWKEPAGLGSAPDAELELKFVYGYRGWDCRNNVHFADSRREVVYHVAGVGVVLDTEAHSQVLNTEHDDDILCLAVHPEGHTVATGEIGKLPKIVLWDANTGVTIRTILYHKRGVANIAFSQDGGLLVSTGMDDERSVAVHNVRTGAVVGRGKAGKGIEVHSVSVGGGSSSPMFVTGGKNHIKFWELPKATAPGGELSSKGGIYSIKAVKARTVVSTAFLGGDALTGMNDGQLLLWKNRSNTKHCQAHTGAVTAMCSIASDGSGGTTIDSRENGPRVITGGRDGMVHVWDLQLTRVWSLSMRETTPLSSCPEVQAVATKESRLLIGTRAAEIYEVDMLDSGAAFRLVQGHFDTRAEVWGLAAHPTSLKFATCGDDMTVRLWDARTMLQTEIVHLGAKARAVAFRPDGTQVAVATFDGKVHVLSSNLQTEVTAVIVASSWIQALSYSPDGLLLGVGAHDSTVYLLETKAYSCRFKLKGHHSFITALDFSEDGRRLQSASGDYELLFWDCLSGRQVLSATEMRDTRWRTSSCTLGWAVQGIWPPDSDGTDVNAVDRSPDGQYLVTGDDFRRVKLFRYPCPKEKSQYRECKGHAEHVTNVKFSADSRYVYSTGGLDKAVLQFEVKPQTASLGSKRK